MTTYRLYVAHDPTEHTVTASNPTKALRELCAAAGLTLASWTGRYGKTMTGQSVAALTVDAGRRRYADHGTTRPLLGLGTVSRRVSRPPLDPV